MTVMTARTAMTSAKYEPHCTMILQLKSHQCAWPILCHRRLKAAIVHDHFTHTHNSTAFKRHLSILSKHQSAENCLNIMRHKKKTEQMLLLTSLLHMLSQYDPGIQHLPTCSLCACACGTRRKRHHFIGFLLYWARVRVRLRSFGLLLVATQHTEFFAL